ncbi:hypothetical protein BN1723_019715, partial [Verticillium longisporum]
HQGGLGPCHPGRPQRHGLLRQGRRRPLPRARHRLLRRHLLHVRPHRQLPPGADLLQRRQGWLHPPGQVPGQRVARFCPCQLHLPWLHRHWPVRLCRPGDPGPVAVHDPHGPQR